MGYTRCVAALALISAAGALFGQDLNSAPAANGAPAPGKGGLHITSVSAYAVYYSSSLPAGGFQVTAVNLPSDIGTGGSVVLDWSRFTERTTFSLNYTPSYTARWRFSSLNALNHQVSLTLGRKLAPRWTLGISGGVNASNYEQSLFAPTTLSNVVSVPSTFNDLASALLSSKYSANPQLGIALTSPQGVQSPVSSLLYGEKMLAMSAGSSLGYSVSPRLAISFEVGGSRTQQLSQGQTVAGGPSVIPDTTSANASFEMSYSLSPRTQLGGGATLNWISSSFLSSYTTTSEMTLGRTLGRRWMMQVHGGVGVSTFAHQAIPTSPPRPIFGGSLAYKTLSHAFIGSYDRVTTDAYGLGASSSSHSSVSWRWRRPGNSWWLDSSFGWEQLNAGQLSAGQSGASFLSNTSGWRTTTGLSRAVGSRAVLETQYSYLDYSGGFGGKLYHSSQSAVRLVVTWMPEAGAGIPR